VTAKKKPPNGADTPPHSVEAEQALLGGLLIDAVAWDNVADLVTREDFYRPDHRLIFEAIANLVGNGKPCDVVTVSQELERTCKLEDAGGLAYLSSVARETPTAANVRAYADIVRERSLLRQLLDVGSELSRSVLEQSTVAEILPRIRSHLERVQAASDRNGDSVELFTFTPQQILAPIPPEHEVLPGIPADAYTLIPGPLSSFKSTLLDYLLVWKATGWDILGLDEHGNGIDIGKAILVTYEDTDARIFKKLQRVIQHGHQTIAERFSRKDADEFVGRAAANLRRLPCSGKLNRRLVYRGPDGMILRNDAFVGHLLDEIHNLAPNGALIGLDPLRLSISVPQNDDEGAEVVVHTLNYLASAIPGSALVVPSHTTKAGAQEPGEGYAAGAYATSGSAVYSQHARSNFHMARLSSAEIRKHAFPDITDEEVRRQRVVCLSHPRLSHGEELEKVYLLMGAGTLRRIKPATKAEGPAQILTMDGPPILQAVHRIALAGIKVSGAALEADPQLSDHLGRTRLRTALKLLVENGYLDKAGTTTNLNHSLTDKGRILLEARVGESH
jgi:hypothetical protein